MTLRARMLIVVAAMVVAVSASALAIVSTQHRFQIDQVDGQLRRASAPLLRLPVFAPPRPSPLPAPSVVSGSQFLSDVWIGEIDSAGRIVQRAAPGLSVDATPRVDVNAALAAARLGRPFTAPAATGGGHFRMSATTRSDGKVVVVGMSLKGVEQSSARLRLAVGLGAGAIVAIAALLVWWVWRLGLRPVQKITQAADAITEGALDHRADVGGTRNEAARLASAFNAMLDARQSAEERLRRFVADASHELRTPLTSIRGYADLYRRGGLDSQAALDDAMRRIGEEGVRMHALVDDLLLLAQLDQGRPLTCDVVDLNRIIRDTATDALAVDPNRTVRVEVSEPLVTIGDDHRLRQVVAALVTNALVHTSGEVSVCGYNDASKGATIEVRDDGPGMDADVAAHAFDRFFRADAGRSRAHGGTGLGLAIVQSIVAALDGTLELDTTPTAGTTVRIHLAAAPIPVTLDT